MPTLPGSAMASDANFNIAKQSKKLQTEVWRDDSWVNLFKTTGILNVEQDTTIAEGGDTSKMYNLVRHDGKGVRGDHDRYSNAKRLGYGQRSITIDLLAETLVYARRKTMSQQIAAFDLSEGVGETLKAWMSACVKASFFNQLGGNTATSILVPEAASTAFTGGDLTKVTGMNATTAPDAVWKAYGSGAVRAGDENVLSTDRLTLRDLHTAFTKVTNTIAGQSPFNLIKGRGYNKVAFIPATGMQQLLEDNTTGALTLKDITLSTLNGGKKLEDIQTYVYPILNMLLVSVPDDYMPSGVNSSTNAVVANTKRVIIAGANALDVKFGAGFDPGNGVPILPGFSVQVDDTHKKLNKESYATVELMWGCKKARIEGIDTALHDVATYVITYWAGA